MTLFQSLKGKTFKELLSIRFFIYRPIYRSNKGYYNSMFGYTYKNKEIYDGRLMQWWIFVRIPKFIGKIFARREGK